MLFKPRPFSPPVNVVDGSGANTEPVGDGLPSHQAAGHQSSNLAHLIPVEFVGTEFAAASSAVRNFVRIVLGWRRPSQVVRIDAPVFTATARVGDLMQWCRRWPVNARADRSVNQALAPVAPEFSVTASETAEGPDQTIVAVLSSTDGCHKALPLAMFGARLLRGYEGVGHRRGSFAVGVKRAFEVRGLGARVIFST